MWGRSLCDFDAINPRNTKEWIQVSARMYIDYINITLYINYVLIK
jgi:hypothetical protein